MYHLSTIETLKLGSVNISQHVIEYFRKHKGEDNVTSSIKEVVNILQSPDIEKLEVPAVIRFSMPLNVDNHNELEFWIHKNSSTIFLVNNKGDNRLVSLALKQSENGIIFDND
jgi:hypothetical protein